MRRPAVRTALAAPALAVALLLGSCGTDTGPVAAEETSADAGTPDAGTSDAPDAAGDRATAPVDLPVPEILEFRSQTVAGDDFDGATLAGRPTVLWFWAPWCPTCRAQISGVSELAERVEGRADVVGVGGLDDPAAIAAFADEVSPAVTVLSDEEGAVWRHFGVTAQSTYVVLDEYGSTLESGYLDDAELAGLVDELVG